MEKIRLKLKAYDHRVLDRSVASIVEAVKRTGAVICGPIPLPTKIRKYTVLKSVHVTKKLVSSLRSVCTLELLISFLQRQKQ